MDGGGDFSSSSSPGQFTGPVGGTNAGAKCSQNPKANRVASDLAPKSNFVQNSRQPINIDWPPIKSNSSPAREAVDTKIGPKYDNLAQMPNQVPRQDAINIMATSTMCPAVTQEPEVFQDQEAKNPPATLDVQSNIGNPPNTKKTREIRMPEFKRPIPGPIERCWPWVQCVENALITDQVRRPMARCNYKRPMPPLVIPRQKMEQLILKATEKDRNRAEIAQRQQEREGLRLRARQRQAKWNYTVESLLERKKQKELAKEKRDLEGVSGLIEEVAVEKTVKSNTELDRAKKLMLYRKGLIRDFHSALGYSKMMQEIEEMKAQSSQKDEPGAAMEKCLQKMKQANTTTDNQEDFTMIKETRPVPVQKPKPVNLKLQAFMQKVEFRAKEHQQEMNSELISLQKLSEEHEKITGIKNMDKKSSTKTGPVVPLCDPNQPACNEHQKQQDHAKYRAELYKDISQKLAADAYIESHEREIERQACEFIEYKRKVDAIQKAKEKQMIDEKVEYHIRKSEAAAQVLIKMQQAKQARANVYDDLKDKWESEWAAKEEGHKTAREKVLEKVVSDFNQRKLKEQTKRCEMDPAREWAKEKLVASENFEQECQRSSVRRQKAEDIALFNKAQAMDKKDQESYKRYLDDVWGLKMKQEYLDEMKEMKTYANDCIQDWKAKGRSTFPMVHAMKKWDYDSGMYPYLFAEGYLERRQNQSVAKSAKQANCPAFETTSNRLGFSSGGC